jgi:hypothetical protein
LSSLRSSTWSSGLPTHPGGLGRRPQRLVTREACRAGTYAERDGPASDLAELRARSLVRERFGHFGNAGDVWRGLADLLRRRDDRGGVRYLRRFGPLRRVGVAPPHRQVWVNTTRGRRGSGGRSEARGPGPHGPPWRLASSPGRCGSPAGACRSRDRARTRRSAPTCPAIAPPSQAPCAAQPSSKRRRIQRKMLDGGCGRSSSNTPTLPISLVPQGIFGGPGRDRTCDQRIMSPPL